jgi:NADH-quinone oxidoreductase subunit E
MKKVNNILSNYKYNESNIIQILDEVQKEYNYLPRKALEYISQKLETPLSKIYSIATFYSTFSLTPRGKHFITVCMGTACHVRGAPIILSRIEDRLGIKAGMTTTDRMFTLETVNCLGACALAPIVVIDENYYGQVTSQKVTSILDKYQKKKNTTKKTRNETK